MIVRMKKATVLGLAHDRGAMLEALRGLGVLHVRPVVAPTGSGLEQAREKAAGLKQLLDVLPAAAEGAKPSGREARVIVAETSDLIEERDEKRAQLETLRAEAARVEPFGSFDPSGAAVLADKGIGLLL